MALSSAIKPSPGWPKARLRPTYLLWQREEFFRCLVASRLQLPEQRQFCGSSHVWFSQWRYEIEIADLAAEELKDIRLFDRRRVVDAIRNQLAHQPTVATTNRKRLQSAVPEFEHTPPIWELRVGEYRVFYDVDE